MSSSSPSGPSGPPEIRDDGSEYVRQIVLYYIQANDLNEKMRRTQESLHHRYNSLESIRIKKDLIDDTINTLYDNKIITETNVTDAIRYMNDLIKKYKKESEFSSETELGLNIQTNKDKPEMTCDRIMRQLPNKSFVYFCLLLCFNKEEFANIFQEINENHHDVDAIGNYCNYYPQYKQLLKNFIIHYDRTIIIREILKFIYFTTYLIAILLSEKYEDTKLQETLKTKIKDLPSLNTRGQETPGLPQQDNMYNVWAQPHPISEHSESKHFDSANTTPIRPGSERQQPIFERVRGPLGLPRNLEKEDWGWI